MNIKKEFDDKFFFTSHINNLVADETKPYSMFGSENARIFKDISTDSFVSNIFDKKDKLFKFIDCVFYLIYTRIPNIHNLLHSNNYYMDAYEYLTVIFKGGNVMLLFFDLMINYLRLSNSTIFETKLNTIYSYLKNHGIDLKNIDGDLFYQNSFETIDDFFNEHKKKFKMSDVDFTMYLNISEPIKYDIVSQLYNKILIDSLLEIRNFFDMYYEHDIENKFKNKINELKYNNYLPFKFNDDPYEPLIENLNFDIDVIKSSNSKNFYSNSDLKVYLESIIYRFIINFFTGEIRIADILLYGTEKKNFIEPNSNSNKYYKYIINIRLITIIYEYLELLKVYCKIHEKKKILQTVNYFRIITLKIIRHHLDNKKRIIIDSEFYNDKTINNFMQEISSKYNRTTNPNLYNTKYSLSFDRKEIIQKINIQRENPDSDLVYYPINKNSANFVNNDNNNEKNEISISKKKDSLIYSSNDIKLYDMVNSDDEHYHYISYNGVIYNSHEHYDRKFDLFRIKFNVKIIKPIISIDGVKINSYNIPSEFVDVSLPAFVDINRKYFYEEIQSEGINYLRYKTPNSIYNWNTYSIHQLYDDLLKILFGPTVVPWYDSKYDKRIVRLLILYMFFVVKKNIHKTPNNNNEQNNECEWICMLSDILKLSNNLYEYIKNANVSNLDSINSIKNVILGPNYLDYYSAEKSNYIINWIFDNIFYKLNENGYQSIIKVDDYYKDFEYVIRFFIFYSYSMKKPCFFDVFNNIRLYSGLLPYEPGKTIEKNNKTYDIIEYNNLKFAELLKLFVNIISVILFFINETDSNCNFNNLSECFHSQNITECKEVKPIHYNFKSHLYKYYTNAANIDNVNSIDNINNEKKQILKNNKNKNKKYIIANKNK